MKILKLLPVTLLATAAVFSLTGHAQEKPAAVQVTTTASEMADGEIRKVNKDTNKITIKHGEIKNLDMPGMTMVFQVKDPAMLDQVKVGDKVKFNAEKTEGAFVVTEIQTHK
jgi:Cu(I)/Ag(I) efflux system periplasmic protein CusF